VPRRDELLDDLPEEFVSLAKDMRALLDAGLIEASAVNDETVRFAIPEDQAGAA
jgi:hypothetical protein